MSRILYLTVLAATVGCSNSGVEKVEPGTGQAGGIAPVTPAVPEESSWSALADSCTNVLVLNFLDPEKGTFWSTPGDVEQSSTYIYWQQAHALDVLLYAAERLRDSDPERSARYLDYAGRWFTHHANNYNRTHLGEGSYGGFFNDWTDDMAWICLTLFHLTDVTGDMLYRETARAVFDRYIWPRRVESGKGTALPWTNHPEDADNLNACTNAPSCLLAVRLYENFRGDYLDIARTLFDFCVANMPDGERVEEPPLTYTQGTFGEACRRLFHVTGEAAYMQKAGQVLRYAVTSDRCTDRATGILRHEGTDMDQSIFKAVYVPYAVNYILDADADENTAAVIREKLLLCARSLDRNLDRSRYPRMYCDYFWGTAFRDGTPSMGAQVSGASLMEGVARL